MNGNGTKSESRPAKMQMDACGADLCPDCGVKLWHESGCAYCPSCGFSECGNVPLQRRMMREQTE